MKIAASYFYLADLVWYIGEHDRLMAHWKAALPNPILEVKLADRVQDFDATLARVLAHLGLPPDQKSGPCASEVFRNKASGFSNGSMPDFGCAKSEFPLLCRFLDAGVTRAAVASAAGVQKAPRHEVAGRFGALQAASAMGI